MKFRILICFLLLSFFSQGQVFVNGFVKDNLGNPIRNASIYQIATKENPTLDSSNTVSPDIRSHQSFYFSQTDKLGSFHILMDTTIDLDLKITSYGNKDTIYFLEKIPREPLFITLNPDTSQLNFQRNYQPRLANYPSEFSMGLDFLTKKYDEFTPLLGELNVDYLRRVPISLTFDFGKNLGRFYTGVTFGFSYFHKTEADTLNLEVNKTLYAFQLGYRIIDSKKIIIQPQISTKLYRTRLINGNLGDKTPLPNYLNNQDLDLRFFQPVLDLGITFGYKYFPKYAVKNNYFIFGIHGGYPIKLRGNPRVNGLRTKLKTDKSIEVGDFGIGIFWRAHFE